MLSREALSSVPQQDMDIHFSVFTTSYVWGVKFLSALECEVLLQVLCSVSPLLTRLICSTVHVDRSYVSPTVIQCGIFTDIYTCLS